MTTDSSERSGVKATFSAFSSVFHVRVEGPFKTAESSGHVGENVVSAIQGAEAGDTHRPKSSE